MGAKDAWKRALGAKIDAITTEPRDISQLVFKLKLNSAGLPSLLEFEAHERIELASLPRGGVTSPT